MKVRKAVFPVAGLGTRFLPATKATPKEMLPIVDKPLIQYAVEEAIAAGIEELIFVTSYAKRAIEDHFDSNYELESLLEKRGKFDLLKIVRDVLPESVSCAYVRQRQALGLGHAVLCAKPLVGAEPFAVILADDLIDGGQTFCLQEMIQQFDRLGTSLIAVEEVPKTQVQSYGVVGFDKMHDRLAQINRIVEKPAPEVAPSCFAVVGRYVLTPRIFDFLEQGIVGSGGEIQLTDAIATLLKYEPVSAYAFAGKRFDCGNKLGYLHAMIKYALKHEELADDFRQLLKQYAE